ncbi:hypothetical protein Tco_0349334 [Tanacetum coccineum]
METNSSLIHSYLNCPKKRKIHFYKYWRDEKGEIAWKMSDIKGISPSYCTHKILMEDDYKPVIQPQRRLNPKVQDVVKNEIVKLLDFGLIYPISTVHGLALFMLCQNGRVDCSFEYDNNEFNPSRHRFFQIPIALEDQENTTFFLILMGLSLIDGMPFGYVMLCHFHRLLDSSTSRHGGRLIEIFMDPSRMNDKVIKGEFEKIKDVKVEDVPLTCDASLEVFNNEVSRLSRMDDDLFTYQVEVANIPCDSKMDDDSEQEADDNMGYDPSDVAFIEWLGSKNFNYKTMDHYTMKALWIYWIRGNDEVELTDEESSDDEDDIAEVFRIDTNIFDYKTPLCSAFKEFNYLLEVDPDLLTKDIIGFKTYEDYKDDWIYEWNKDWYEALEDYKLKDEALRNKAIMEGFIKEDDDESRYEQKRRWNIYTNCDDAYEINHGNNEREELCEIHELPMCNIRRYMMIKYSFNNDDEYVAVKEDEYDDLTIIRKEAYQAYQEIFWIMDEGWMVTRAE